MPTKKFTSVHLPIIITCVLLLAAGIFWYMSHQRNDQTMVTDTEDYKPQPSRAQQSSQSLSDLQTGKKLVYTHPVLGFNFEYPEGFNVGDVPEGDDGETLLVQKGNTGFQIYISPLEEDVEMTAEKIKTDIPDMQVINPINLNLDGTKALTFDSRSGSGIDTREIWFSRNKQLYQISAYREFAPALEKIIETWKWEK